jgi:hypothetical protein
VDKHFEEAVRDVKKLEKARKKPTTDQSPTSSGRKKKR